MGKTRRTLLLDKEVPLLGAHPPVTHSEDASKGQADKYCSPRHSQTLPGRDAPLQECPTQTQARGREGQGLSEELPIHKGRRQVSPKGGGINSR